MIKRMFWFNYCIIICIFGLVSSLHKTILHGCNTIQRIEPRLDISSLFQNKEEKVRITSTISNQNTEKGCGRDTFDIQALYGKCNIGKVIPLLPSRPDFKEAYVKNLPYKITDKGGTDYIFDGGTAVRYPTKQLPSYWYEGYTLTGWVFIEEHHDRQYLFSWSDGNTPRHDTSGLFLARHPDSNHVTCGFHHSHIDALTGEKCVIKRKWKLHEKNRWNFIALSFQKCDVELTVNNQRLNVLTSPMHINTPEKHIQPKFVIGARWAGSIQKYDGFLHGRISGFMLKTHENLSMQKLDCLFECQEKVKLAVQLPSGFQEEISSNGIVVQGSGTKEDIHNLVNDVIYVNTVDFPEKEERKLTFEIQNLKTKKLIQDEFNIIISRKPNEIRFQGDCSGQKNFVFTKHGIRLCTENKIVMTGCVSTLDTLVVESRDQLTNKEKVFIPPAYLKRYQLNLVSTDTGFIVYGVASVSQYTEILHHVKYAHIGKVAGTLTRTIIFTASSRNGLIKSKDFSITFTVSQLGLVVLPTATKSHLDHPNKKPNVFPIPLMNSEARKQVAMATNKTNHHFGIWIVIVCVLSSFAVAFLVGVGYRRHADIKRKRELFDNTESNPDPTAPVDFYWDEEDLPMRLTINPSERVSITNDPYADIILKQQSDDTISEDSVYSEDEDTNFDNDSIRQLEWDNLENSLDSLLQNNNEEDVPLTKSDNGNGEVYL